MPFLYFISVKTLYAESNTLFILTDNDVDQKKF